MNPWTRKFIKYGKIFCNWYDFDDHKYGNLFVAFQWVRVAFIFTCGAVNCSFFFTTDLSQGVNRSVIICPGVTFISIKTLLISLKRRRLVHLTFEMDKLISKHDEEWEKELLNKKIELGQKLTTLFFSVSCLFWILYFPVRLFFSTILYFLDIISTRIVVPLPFSGFLDDDDDKKYVWQLVELGGFLWGTCSVSCFLAVDSIFFVYSLCIVAELQIIKKKVQMLNEKLGAKQQKGECVELIEMCKTHVMLVGIRDNMKDVFGISYGFQNVFSALVLCFQTYAILTVKSPFTYLPLAVSTLIFLQVNFACCYLGEWMKTENDELFEALYDLPWYNQNTGFVKTLIMMLRQMKKPYTIGFKTGDPLVMRTFGDVIETAYKLFAVLRSANSQLS